MNEFSIDIVVPTFRIDERVILAIINLPYPHSFSVSFYIVADNPAIIPSESIRKLYEAGKINLLVNKQNMGAAASRNVGIRAGKSKWILFLDDDIEPAKELLIAYCDAIQNNPDALGFAGVTDFPPPFNAVTQALKIQGTINSFTQPRLQKALTWSPTANVMLNRTKIDADLFDGSLVNAEDIDFLTRNSFLFNEKYLPVPAAIVRHPWWNNGQVQTKRMLSYGSGASQIAKKKLISNFTYRDFTNTAETLLLLILISPLFYLTGNVPVIIVLIPAVIVAEFITNWIRCIIKGKTFSPLVAFHVMWIKNCYEFSFLYTALKNGYINGFARRIDMGFAKPHPSPFRLNRWKIIKMLILVSILVMLLVIPV